MLKIKKKILFCAAEAAPLAKIGGLADVVDSLPPALKKQGVEVRVIMPAHGSISLRFWRAKKLASFSVNFGKKKERVVLLSAKVEGVHYYFLQSKNYFSGAVYGENTLDKYLFFSQAVAASMPFLAFTPDIIHAHDFHTAGVLLTYLQKSDYPRPKLVLTIHNLQHQGWVSASKFKSFGFNPDIVPAAAKNKAGNWVNILAAGIMAADKITTVSPSYAQEIMTKKYGQELEKLLISRQNDLVGILNGLDVVSYNPATDKALAFNYNRINLVAGKAINKQALRSYFGLSDSPIPLLALVARLSDQKGIDLFNLNKLKTLIKKYPFQLIILGTGEKKFESLASSLAVNLPEAVRAEIAFDDVLARNLYAGSDYFLVPSRFEPCGLTQMIAMRYGSVPIVRATGGLKDTVIDGYNGFVFKNYTDSSLLSSLQRALRLYYQEPDKYQALRRAGMSADWSWQASVPRYLDLYNSL
ncbi:MAG TPA: glycogen/starch synthase [bacterium]|jgi:starch synthase|nr:MAG: Glycogen synthase [Parcubacteria group bacterium ADurb.Bin115]HNU81224.1 glycogen/starch synthase [bacterium]HOD86875.1 glycogen/starch synthase [bacterium]HPW05501.1 glycogen/starch synthase [bacterium]HPY99207.1 glycogen/starch synthase [bacterium]